MLPLSALPRAILAIRNPMYCAGHRGFLPQRYRETEVQQSQHCPIGARLRWGYDALSPVVPHDRSRAMNGAPSAFRLAANHPASRPQRRATSQPSNDILLAPSLYMLDTIQPFALH